MANNSLKCNVIDWRITARCNSACKYCYASNNLPDLDVKNCQKIVKEIINSRCDVVCISGGEPLLYPGVLSVIEQLHNHGISIFLSTNGTEYMQYREELEKYITKLSLPLDGYDEESNAINGRSVIGGASDSFTAVKNILDYYSNHQHSFAIKIGTVLTRKNCDITHFERMYNFLRNYPIEMWKIYECIPEGRGFDNHDELLVSTTELLDFQEKFDKIKRKAVENEVFNCSIATRMMRDKAYLIIQPDGTVMIPIESGLDSVVSEEVIGDLKTDSISKVLKQWKKKVSGTKFSANFESRNISRTIAKKHIDAIDKEILYHLDKEPLESITNLSNKLRQWNITEDELKHRIDLLYSIRAIRRIMPVVNIAQFGLSIFAVNLYFKKDPTMAAIEISGILANDPYIGWVAECYEYNNESGDVIFRISIFARDNNAFIERMRYLQEMFGETLYRYEYDMVPVEYIYSQDYITNNNSTHGLDNTRIGWNKSKIHLSKNEYAVLTAMNSTKRLSIKSIANSTTLKENKIQRIIDSLLEKAIINKFQIVLDSKILGYKSYLFLIKFNHPKKDCEIFEKYLKKMPSVNHVNFLSGEKWDMDFEIHVEYASMCSAIWSEVEKKFKDIICESKLVRIEREHKFKFLIDVTLEAIGESVDPRLLPNLLDNLR